MEISLEDVRHALVELGRLRFGEMSIEDAIREIVETTHSMFDVDGAGLMLADASQHLRSVAASDDRFAHLEELQVRHQEGPCIEAFDTKQLVSATDLSEGGRWPLFSEAAVEREIRAVLASPLPYNQDAVGVVAVLSERSRPWSPANELALLAFTDLAALLIASIIQGEQQSELAGQLQGALNSRQVIEQSKGILMGAQGISARKAYEQLRARARSERRKLAEVCAEIVQDAARQSLSSRTSCYTLIASHRSRPEPCGPRHAGGCPCVFARRIAKAPPDSGRPSPRPIG
jgi:GAF domain-containing protein